MCELGFEPISFSLGCRAYTVISIGYFNVLVIDEWIFPLLYYWHTVTRYTLWTRVKVSVMMEGLSKRVRKAAGALLGPSLLCSSYLHVESLPWMRRQEWAGWAGQLRNTHPYVDMCPSVLSLLNPIASSKSEGSPSQRLENAVKKPEDKKEVFRPLKPAVRIVQNQFYLFQTWMRSFY